MTAYVIMNNFVAFHITRYKFKTYDMDDYKKT